MKCYFLRYCIVFLKWINFNRNILTLKMKEHSVFKLISSFNVDLLLLENKQGYASLLSQWFCCISGTEMYKMSLSHNFEFYTNRVPSLVAYLQWKSSKISNIFCNRCLLSPRYVHTRLMQEHVVYASDAEVWSTVLLRTSTPQSFSVVHVAEVFLLKNI